MKKPEIWIVEDDASCRFIYDVSLAARYECQYFESLTPLLLELKKRQPALLIADLLLKDSNFLDFFSSQDCRYLGDFIVVSGLDDIGTLRQCYEEGALDYLAKPFNKNQLLVKIERILAKAAKMEPVANPLSPADALLQNLTLRERQIYLHLRFGRPISPDQLQKLVWKNVQVGRKALDVHIFNLRKKLAPWDTIVEFDATQGYRLVKKH